ncbi:MAG: O-antigen ligase family protein [Clostridiales bacterium]|nr:O-antigen ligase family protein [Clostridiales bacterium]
MLIEAFPKLKNSRAVRLVREFFRSPYYCALVVFLMACSELFSWELAIFYVYLFFGFVICMLDEDMLGLAPIACSGYMTISAANNVGKNAETALLKTPQFTLHFMFIFAAAGILLVSRFITKLMDREKRGVPNLTYGMVLLGVAYIAAGAFSGCNWRRSAAFGAAQILSVVLAYFYLYFTVNWKTVPKHYFISYMSFLGVGIALEVLGMYALPNVFVDGAVNRVNLFTGWGIYNNVGGMMAMCIPAPFYFAATKKHGWAYAILGTTFLLSTVLTQSRSSILFGAVIYVISALTALFCAKGWERLKLLVVYGALLVALLVSMYLLRDRLEKIFRSLVEIGLNPSSRTEIYQACWDKFLQSPFLGVGFYETPGGILHEGEMIVLKPAPDGVFIPPRAHNTFFQLVASGGAFALFAYLVHRIETIRLVFHRPNAKKIFLGLCILALLLTSLLDCHFFNFGPAILYSGLLVFIECIPPDDPLKRKRKKS